MFSNNDNNNDDLDFLSPEDLLNVISGGENPEKYTSNPETKNESEINPSSERGDYVNATVEKEVSSNNKINTEKNYQQNDLNDTIPFVVTQFETENTVNYSESDSSDITNSQNDANSQSNNDASYENGTNSDEHNSPKVYNFEEKSDRKLPPLSGGTEEINQLFAEITSDTDNSQQNSMEEDTNMFDLESLKGDSFAEGGVPFSKVSNTKDNFENNSVLEEENEIALTEDILKKFDLNEDFAPNFDYENQTEPANEDRTVFKENTEVQTDVEPKEPETVLNENDVTLSNNDSAEKEVANSLDKIPNFKNITDELNATNSRLNAESTPLNSFGVDSDTDNGDSIAADMSNFAALRQFPEETDKSNTQNVMDTVPLDKNTELTKKELKEHEKEQKRQEKELKEQEKEQEKEQKKLDKIKNKESKKKTSKNKNLKNNNSKNQEDDEVTFAQPVINPANNIATDPNLTQNVKINKPQSEVVKEKTKSEKLSSTLLNIAIFISLVVFFVIIVLLVTLLRQN